MFTTRTLLALFAFAVLVPLAGCRHHKCCSRDAVSFAPPPACCPAPGAPATFLPPPGP